MAQDVSHLVGFEHEIDGHHDRTTAGQRKPQGRKTMRVAGQHSHFVALGHTDLGQASCQAGDQGVELGISPGGATAHDAGFSR